jgi:4'-phosphopantetheinyl transferase
MHRAHMIICYRSESYGHLAAVLESLETPQTSHMDLGPFDIHVWFRITECLAAADVEAALRNLSEAERITYDRFRFVSDRRDYAIGHDLVRRSLSRYERVSPADWYFETEPRGKPCLASKHGQLAGLPPLQFNLSHTRGLVAAAVARNLSVGIDVEVFRRFAEATEIARRFFSESEVEGLEQCPDDLRLVRFVELWTLKEAFLKATGEGISERLSAISFDLGQPAIINFSTAYPLDMMEWHFALYAPTPTSRLAVAACGRTHPQITTRCDFENAGSRSDYRPLRTSEQHRK